MVTTLVLYHSTAYLMKITKKYPLSYLDRSPPPFNESYLYTGIVWFQKVFHAFCCIFFIHFIGFIGYPTGSVLSQILRSVFILVLSLHCIFRQASETHRWKHEFTTNQSGEPIRLGAAAIASLNCLQETPSRKGSKLVQVVAKRYILISFKTQNFQDGTHCSTPCLELVVYL